MCVEPFSATTVTVSGLLPTDRPVFPPITTEALASAATATTEALVEPLAKVTVAPSAVETPLTVTFASELFELSGVTYAFTV